MKRVFSLIIAMLLALSVFTPAVFADDNTATYQIVTYCMDIYGDAYEIVGSEELSGVIDEYVSVTPEEKEGFSFNSYISQTGGYVDRYGDLTLYLYYDRMEWCFTIYAGNEVYDEFITYYGSPIEEIDDIFLEDYLFEGWEEEIPEYMPNCDFDLHAKLSPLGKTYVSVDGGSVTYNDQTIYSAKPVLEKLGTKLSLTAHETDEYEFLYWINTETNRVVSFEPVYTFSVCPYIYLRAKFYESYEGYHHVAYLNLAGTELQAEDYEIGEEIEPPTPTPVPGYEFDHWSISAEEASNTPGNVIVRPVYNKVDNSKYTVIFTNESGVSGAGEYDNEEIVTISSADREDFSYWRDENGEIVSYYPTYSFRILYDAIFTAVYFAPEREKVACRIVKSVPNTTNNVITVYEEWSVDSAFSVHATGFVVTVNPSVGTDSDLFQIGKSGVLKGTSTLYTLNGVYSLNLTSWTSGRTYYVRPYVTVGDSDGQHTVYGTIRSYTAP